jgi:preprotein translocase subunit YajC
MGGIHGTIQGFKENGKLVIVKVDRNTNINLSKTAIAGLAQHVTDEDLEQPA